MHLKREMSPNKWPIARKKLIWTIKPRPGTHPIADCLPLGMIIRDSLNIADKMSEVKTLLNRREVLVDGKAVTEYRFPIGLMDTVIFTETKDTYRMLPTHAGIAPEKIDIKSAGKKLLKVTKITTIKKGLSQYCFHDGRTLISDEKYKTGDTVEFDLKECKVTGHKPFKEGETALITGGNKIGLSGKIEKIEGNNVTLKNETGEYKTIKKYVFILDKELK